MKTYDPKQIILIVGGVQISGYADDSFVTVRRNADAWALNMGVDGEGTRSKSNDGSGQIEVALMQTSQSNTFLSNLAIADETSNSGLVPMMMKDALGNTLAVAEQAYVKKMPDLEYGREAGSRTWILETDNLKLMAGGN